MYNQSHFAEVWKEKLFGEWRKDGKKTRKGRELSEGGKMRDKKKKGGSGVIGGRCQCS